MAVRRDVPSWLIGDSPSGAEASSGPPDTCRSTGRGVEEATGIPPVGTPGNHGCPHSYFHSVLTVPSDSVGFSLNLGKHPVCSSEIAILSRDDRTHIMRETAVRE